MIGRFDRNAVLERLPQQSVGAELGIWRGDFSAQLLKRVRPRTLFLIDPWRYEESEAYRGAWYGGRTSQKSMDHIHARVQARFAREIRHGTVVILRSPSSEAAQTLAVGSLDWVYIDANHLYQFVLNDLWTYSARV